MRSSQLEQAKLNIEMSIEWYTSAEWYDLLERPYQQLARLHLDLGDIGKDYMNGHIQTIEDSNARGINKLCSHLALAGIYSIIIEQRLESSLGLNPEHVKWKQSFHYGEAYKLTQGDLDNSAHVVLQREMGIAQDENIGTYNIQQCVVVVAHDTKTDRVVLSHFDRYSGPLKFIEQILEQFPSQNKIDIHVYGGRDRTTLDESGEHLVSNNNIDQVLKQIYYYRARVNVISIDVAGSLPPGVVYRVKDRKFVHATPNHPDKSISSRAATINLSLWPKTGGYLYPIREEDFSKGEEKRIVLFNDEQKRQLQEIGGRQRQSLASGGSASFMWSSNQILHPIDDTLQQGVSSMEIQQGVLNNIDGVVRNPNTRPISDHQLVLAQTNRQNPGVEDFIDYYRKELQLSDLDDIEIDASLSGDLDDIEMLDLIGCSGPVSKKKRSTKGSCIDSRSDEMIMKIKLKELESKINDEVLSRHEEIENVAAYNVNKSDMLSNALQSLKLSKMLLLMSQKSEVSIELQEKAYYNALIDIGALIHDHKNHVHGSRLSALESRVRGNQLFSVAHDLYYLSKSEGNVDRDKLYSDQVKSKISSYIEGGNRLDDIYSEFNIIDIKGYFSDSDIKDFYAEAKAYDKEVITIHSTQVFVDEVEVCVKVKDNNGNHQKLVIGDIASIQNIENYVLDEETSEIKLRIDDDKEYTTTQELEEGHTKHYLNIPGGYKVKVGNIISSFTKDTKEAIHSRLHGLELLASKKDVEEISDAEITDQDYNNVIGEIRQSLLQKGVSESTFDQFKKQLDYVNEEVFKKYVNDISKELTKNNIEFDGSKFNSAKLKGAKVSKLFSVMAIYDLFDSVKDLKTLGHDKDFLKLVFGVNGILDAMDDVRSSISISRNSGIGKLISKIPWDTRKAFVKVISNPVVEGITFATVAYQFERSIDAIVKGDHHPLNYYFATSNGIKLASMSMKPIRMGVSAAVKGLGVTTKALKVVLAISNVLGKLSMATAVIDSAVTIGITIYETTEYVKAIASEIPLSDIEQAALFIDHILREFSLFYLIIQEIAGNKPLGQHYEDAIVVKSYLDHIKKVAKEILMKKPEQMARPGQCSTSIRRDYEDSNKEIAAVVQYVNSIEEKYSEVIKFERETLCKGGKMGCEIEEICKFEKKYGDITYGCIRVALSLTSLDISKVLPLKHSTLNGKEVYLIDNDIKHLPHITLDEYNNGLRVVSVPFHFRANSSTCSGVINEEYKSNGNLVRPLNNKCNSDKVYRECTQTFTLSGRPFIFANERASIVSPILYLSLPNRFEVLQNRPAIVYLPEGRIVFHGSKNHDNVFIVGDNTSGSIFGGEENNAIVMNYNTSDIFAGLCDGIIDMAGSKITLMGIPSGYIYNYISHSTANQNITTGCKTRYVDAGEGGGSNSIQHHDVNCQDEDYEVRKVRKNDTHLRSMKSAIFIIDESSGNGASIRSNNLKSKRGLDTILIENIDIARLRINEYQTGYRLDIIDCGKQGTVASIEIDSFEKLVIQLKKVGITKTITVQNKSLPDIIGDMAYQMKLNHSGTYVNRKIMDNSKKRSKAVVLADITGSENTTAYVFAKEIADSSKNLGIIVSQIELIKGDITLHYAINNINQIKLILNNSTGISAGERENYNSLLFEAIKNGNLDGVKDLLDKGAEIEAEKSGFTALTHSLFCEKDYIVYFLLEMGADVNNRGKNNVWPLELAVYLGDLNLVKELVSKGVNICPENYGCEKLPEVANKAGNPEIANFLKENQNESPVQRKRRHHSSRKLLATDLSNQPEIAASSANQKSSWINVFTNTIVDAVKDVSQFIFSPFKPAIDMEHSQSSKAMTTQSIDTNGTLLLLDVFIRKITGQKYISNNIRSIFEKEAQIYALPIAKGFEQALESAAIESGIPVTNLKFNPVEVSLKVAGQIRSGKFSEISKTLYSSAKEACPEFEQTGEFLVHVKSHLEEFLAKKETVFLQQKQTADQPTSSVSRKVVTMESSKKPETFLNGTLVTKGIKHVLGL